MTDPGHLEKMARELKCPICLSLLKSAVSLRCNHVFCNLCIMETMKLASDCPICKAPFRRREVCPAPHMDNLVTVFKSMEAAAGFNILTSQIAPSRKSSEDELPIRSVENYARTESIIPKKGRLKREAFDNTARKKKGKVNITTSERCPAMPSFPAKKRVHVTPYPISETPQRPEKVSKSGSTGIELEANKALGENKEVAADMQESLFAPFFWLREENDDDDDEALEKLSSQPTSDPSQPYNAPCFSDIKDSEEDKSPIKMTPTSKSNVPEVFDSEMFEWTQRDCSPELCSTPKKTAGRKKLKAVEEKHCHEFPETEMMLRNEASPSKSMKNKTTVQADGNAKRSISLKKETLKRRKRSGRCSQTKHYETPINTSNDNSFYEVSIEDLVNSGEVVKDSSHGTKDDPNQGARSSENDNNDDIVTQVSKEFSTINAKIHNHEKENIGAVLPLLKYGGNSCGIEPGMRNNTKKIGKQLRFQPKRKHMKKPLNDVKKKVLEEVPSNVVSTSNQGYREETTDPNVLPSKYTEYHQGCKNGRDKCNQELPKKKGGGSMGSGRRNQTSDTLLDNDLNKGSLISVETAGYKDIQTSINLEDSDSLATRRRLLQNKGDTILRKCGDIKPKIRCAFCLSYHDTKDSGEMMHYFNGKPVAADYNGGVNVIHSHKNCTEWAPDVYFEDDLAVNLASELARSRRIKCNCCGIKGAALGCYEKSCRKSFHFTCAKYVSGCRWDNDSFVMLCPLHSSSKLPRETSETQRQRRKSSSQKEEQQDTSILKASHDTSRMWTWPSGSLCKWVLCCSALTATEKETISEFARLTGVSISKTWSPAVTHVITSTDAHGACKRTLKFLMGILNGKWILSIEWIKACIEAMGPVDEEKFEITVDVHGIIGGPQLGRMKTINKEPKLFGNFRFYLNGEFMPKYKSYLQDLVTSAGGTILLRKPIIRDQEQFIDKSSTMETVIIYSLEPPLKRKCGGNEVVWEGRRGKAEALADACGGKVATNSWILDSIAASKLQPLTC